MKSLKKKVSVLLCIMLTVPALLGVLPQAKLEVQAAETTYSMYGVSNNPYKITKNTKGFYAGDYIDFSIHKDETYQYFQLSMFSGAKYKSSKTSVATVNSKGLVTPKKKGKTTITASYKGLEWSMEIWVVDSVGSTPKMYNSLKKPAQTLVKAYGSGIDAKNRHQVMNAYRIYKDTRTEIIEKYWQNYIWSMDRYGFIPDKNYRNLVLQPIFARANAVEGMVKAYVNKRNPIGTRNTNTFTIKSVTGKGSSATVKLTSKVTADQIFGIQAAMSYLSDNTIANSNKVKFPVYIRDVKTGHRYYATASAVKGQNALSIKTSSLKMKKGTTYMILGYSDNHYMTKDWTLGKSKSTFKAK